MHISKKEVRQSQQAGVPHGTSRVLLMHKSASEKGSAYVLGKRRTESTGRRRHQGGGGCRSPWGGSSVLVTDLTRENESRMRPLKLSTKKRRHRAPSLARGHSLLYPSWIRYINSPEVVPHILGVYGTGKCEEG